MRRNLNFKRLAVALAVAAGVAGAPNVVSADEIVRVLGQNNQELGCYSAGNVSTIEFGEGTAPVADEYSEIVIPLSEKVQFIMVKVKGCKAYTLKNAGTALTAGAWANGAATQPINDFWIGKFEVTQGVWREVMGYSDEEWKASTIGKNSSLVGDSYPAINVSWEDICTGVDGKDSFLKLLNEKIKGLKDADPKLKSALEAAIGEREFRLPSEWEWEYAAAGGANNELLGYWYSGISGIKADNAVELEKVAVNSVNPNTASSPARVGSKQPNALWLYDMSGNVWEWCDGIYPGQENKGFLDNNGDLKDPNRPYRGGSYANGTAMNFRVSLRGGINNTSAKRSTDIGFRLAL